MSYQGFAFKEIDQEGFNILNVISEAQEFNYCMYQAIKPFIKGNVLEIGSGVGTITQYVIRDKFKITASDIRDNYCTILRNRFIGNKYLTEVRNIDIVHPDFDEEYQDLFDKFNSLIILNVVEHVENDLVAIKNCGKLLTRNGNLVVLVPAYSILYNNIDKELLHYRRYTKSILDSALCSADFQIFKTKYFNFIGIVGWWFSGSILRRKTIAGGQMKLYNKFVPIIKIIDKMLMNKIGLSVIAIGQKK